MKAISRPDYINAEKLRWRNECFKDHVATVITKTEHLTLIEFRNPKSWNYGMRFLVHAQWVCVMGDVYEATYQWSDTVTLEFLAGIDFGYFRGKCRASPKGKEFTGWSDEVAWHGVSAFIADMEESDTSEGKKNSKRGYLHDLKSLHDFDRDSVCRIAQQAYDETGDADLARMIAEFGDVPDGACIGHFVGIQMAIAQVQAAPPTESADPAKLAECKLIERIEQLDIRGQVQTAIDRSAQAMKELCLGIAESEVSYQKRRYESGSLDPDSHHVWLAETAVAQRIVTGIDRGQYSPPAEEAGKEVADEN